jgi:hypothetical protein
VDRLVALSLDARSPVVASIESRFSVVAMVGSMMLGEAQGLEVSVMMGLNRVSPPETRSWKDWTGAVDARTVRTSLFIYEVCPNCMQSLVCFNCFGRLEQAFKTALLSHFPRKRYDSNSDTNSNNPNKADSGVL